MLEDRGLQVSSIVSLGKNNYKYFLGYKDDDHEIKQLRIMLPKTSAYVNIYDKETKRIHFFVIDEELLGKYNGFWNRVSNSIKRNLIANPSTIKNFSKPK